MPDLPDQRVRSVIHETPGPLIMHAGDTITDHQYVTAAKDGMHITVTDLTRGGSGTIILNSKIDGPLTPETLSVSIALKAADSELPWLQFQPLQIKSVTFGDGSSPQAWSAISDFGGAAEVNHYCGAANYGTPFCTYPWYAFNGTDNAFTYGGDYPGTTKDFGQAQQFQQQRNCTSPLGGFAQYCSTILR